MAQIQNKKLLEANKEKVKKLKEKWLRDVNTQFNKENI